MKQKEKIFFVYPPSKKDKECALPFDMMLLSSIAKSAGFDTKFKDYALEKGNIYDFLRDLRVYKPDFIVINTNPLSFAEDLSILTQAGELLENSVVIAKGTVFNYNSSGILQKYPEIDIALKDDCELAFEEIIKYKNLKNIKGITYQVSDKIVFTPQRKQPDNLDFLPNLDRDLIDSTKYTSMNLKPPISAILFSKGCSSKCIFCPHANSKVRYRSASLIIDEIKECISKYGITNFQFIAEDFNYDNQKVEELLKLILIENLKITFSVKSKIDSFDYNILKLMKKAGCNLITTGIESPDDLILEKIGKNINVEKIKHAIEIANKAKVPLCARYITGLPWQNKANIKKTFEFAKKMNTSHAIFENTPALFGTELYKYIQKNRLSKLNPNNPYIFNDIIGRDITENEINKANESLNKKYYRRIGYYLKALFRA